MFESLSLTHVAIFLAVITLLPAFLYVVGLIRDPFHPLILVGVLSYFIAVRRFLMNPEPHLELLGTDTCNTYLFVVLISVVGMYLGWWLGGRGNRDKSVLAMPVEAQYQINQISAAALVCTIIGVGCHFIFFREYEVSGWLYDMQMLWVTGAILWIQLYYLSPRNQMFAATMFFISVVPALHTFVAYGGRGDTFRLATMVELSYLIRRKRPTKALFITVAICLGMTLSTLQLTRDLVSEGEATNRVVALWKVIPRFFAAPDAHVDPGDEDTFGASYIRAMRESGHYGYGRTLTVGLIVHCIPRGLFPDKDEYTVYQLTYANNIGSTGCAPSGFAWGFGEFGWACSIIWIFYGFVYRRLWDGAVIRGNFLFQGLVVGVSIATLYAISQELLTAEVNLLYVVGPLMLIHHFSKRKSEEFSLPATA